MRTAIFADIHGDHPALQAVLAEIDTARCDRIICLGDVVEGATAGAECVRELMRRQVIAVRGNHDELFASRRSTPEADWLRGLPETITEDGVLYTHISPRGDDRGIMNRYIAWSVLDDTQQKIAFVGHAHIAAVYSWHDSVIGAAQQIPIEYGRPIMLDPADRYIICPGSVMPGRDDEAAPRYIVYDDAAAAVEFRRAL